jgi:hypothetical protein
MQSRRESFFAALWHAIVLALLALTALVFLVASVGSALAGPVHVEPPLVQGAAVRVRVGGLGPGWVEGNVFFTRDGCTMVRFKRRTLSGYEAVALRAVQQLERAQAGGWTAASLAPALAREPKVCGEGDND